MTDFILDWTSDFEITDLKQAHLAVKEQFPGTYEHHSDILKYCSAELKDDKTLVTQITKQDYRALKYASDAIREDENFVLQLLQIAPASFEFASYRIRDNKTSVLNACAINLDILSHMSNRLQDDEEFIFKIAQDYDTYSVLKYMSPRLRNDLRVVSKAIAKFPSDLKYASASMLDNKYCVLFLLKSVITDPTGSSNHNNNNCFCYNYISYRLRRDEEVARELAAFNGAFLKGFSDHLRKDESVVLLAVKSSPSSITYADAETQKNEKIIYEALKVYIDNPKYDDLDLNEFWTKHICKEIQQQYPAGAHDFMQKYAGMQK
jgi:hypothetical protein